MIGRRSPIVAGCVAAVLTIAHALPAPAAPADVAVSVSGNARVTVGSKKFTESVVLGELLCALARSTGAAVVHRRELGGTRILWEALRAGQLDAYPEYTGTLREEIYAGVDVASDRALDTALAGDGLRISRPLGFNNTYALGMLESRAAADGVTRISDLATRPRLRLGFTNEFMDRRDGWPSLQRDYRLPQQRVRGLDHDLAYRALANGSVDVVDLYSTDADIAHYDIRVLEDDKAHFPRYDAVILYRADLAERAPEALAAMRSIEGRISAADMIAMNAAAKLEHVPEARVAARFLSERLGIATTAATESPVSRLLRHTREHLALVTVSLTAAVLVAVPLGMLAARSAVAAQIVLATTGIVQTIPALALLVFMIPLLGIGGPPAIAALFLYSLLPIVRNTYAGLHGISIDLLESADALGLSSWQRLRLVEAPLASPAILAGIKTSAVINVGTATLGALIGAGGYGQPILTGIRLDDIGLILQGAVPAAALALLAQGGFDLIERWTVPRGLRLRQAGGPRAGEG